MKLLTLTPILLALAVPASAATVTASGSNSLWNVDCPKGNPDTCVIGEAKVFGIESASLTFDNNGNGSADILTNFGDSTLTPFSMYGVAFSAADMLITAGSSEYALVLDGHDGLDSGGLYLISSTEDAQTVLGNPPGIYRNDLPVWASPSGATLISAGTVHIDTVGNGTSSPKYDISITGLTGGKALFNASTLAFEIASATCGNGVLYGSEPCKIPEPGTLALMGAALVGLAFLRRSRNRG
jgi:hypothetical protein